MSRSYEVSDDDNQPLTWVQGRPLYATHIVIGVLVASLLATTGLIAFGARSVLSALAFDSAAVLSGQAWRVVTYGFLNPPSLSFVVDLALLFWFGREVEKHLGTKSFLRLYLFIYLVPSLILAALGFWHPLSLSGHTGALAVFVAFATLYPGATLAFNLLACWVAGILVGIFTLVALARHDWASLVALWSSSAYAFAFIRHSQGHFSLPSFRSAAPVTRVPHRTPATATVRVGSPRPASAASSAPGASRPSRADDMTEVDALLDKINSTGLGSLTPREHERLAAAQARLARRYEQNRS